jgi:hypothetical protein
VDPDLSTISKFFISFSQLQFQLYVVPNADWPSCSVQPRPDPESAAALGGRRSSVDARSHTCSSPGWRGAEGRPAAGLAGASLAGIVGRRLSGLAWHRQEVRPSGLDYCHWSSLLSNTVLNQNIRITSSVVALVLGLRVSLYALERWDACAQHLTLRTGRGSSLLKIQNELEFII